ncbi:hypothetical protein HYC85_011261 [Camellia sinensis]|uniref:Transmembrane protein n=1 Tax=Camellia sinensis TaxID=4442 RepID=A0A7J7HBQ5_CAMSI|nr:hypothetical protein HYC85_011261 [Camellia sinensis]
MRVLMTEDSNNVVSNSFLLDNDSSIFITSLKAIFLCCWPLIFCLSFMLMTSQNQWIRLTFRTKNHHRLFVKIQDSSFMPTDHLFIVVCLVTWRISPRYYIQATHFKI